MTSRRESLKALAAFGSLASLARPARAQSEADIPPQGIGHRIKHVSYSDQGGKPDAVQVMVNRRHVYVGHMFSGGITILDAADPRQLKPVRYWHAGGLTRTHQLQVANDILLDAEALFRNKTTGAWWELSTVRMFRFGALTTVGHFAELDKCVDDCLKDAARRDDRYTESSMTRMFNVTWLVRDAACRAAYGESGSALAAELRFRAVVGGAVGADHEPLSSMNGLRSLKPAQDPDKIGLHIGVAGSTISKAPVHRRIGREPVHRPTSSRSTLSRTSTSRPDPTQGRVACGLSSRRTATRAGSCWRTNRGRSL